MKLVAGPRVRRTAMALAVVAALAVAIPPAVADDGSAGAAKGGSAGLPAGFGSAGPPAGFGSWSQLFAAQRILDDTAFRVQAAATGRASGYAGVRVDVRTNSLTLYWKGEPPATVGRVVAEARAAGIGVTVAPARYTKAELAKQVDAITRDASATGTTGERVLTVTPRVDGSGIDVGVAQAAGAEPAGAEPAGAQPANDAPLGHGLPNLRRAVQSGMVTVRAEQPGMAYTREVDTAPLWAGALIFHDDVTIPVCTSGFSTHADDGSTYLMTAAHCGGPGTRWDTGGGSNIGAVEHWIPAHDAAFIRADSGPGAYGGPAVYAGMPHYLSVGGASHTNVGDFVCVSGALTGEVCSVQVDNNDITDCSDPNMGCVHSIGAVSTDGRTVAGQGDSGGPVFSYDPDNGRVIARGLVHKSYGRIYNCANPLHGRWFGHPPTRHCSAGVRFTDVVSGIDAVPGMHISTV